MLAEALLYARARLAGQRNPYGHLTELVGIWARHRRQRQAWSEHLTRSRSLCLRAAEGCPPGARRTALVLGAGALLDVPLEQLSHLFRRVVLADMAFLPATCRLAKGLGNVELVQTDLSAGMNRLPSPEELAAKTPCPLPDLSLGLLDLDFAYSANLLSQLPIFAIQALRKKVQSPESSHMAEALQGYAADLVQAHLAGLDRLDCPACLVTDTLERGFTEGQLKTETDLLFGVAVALPGETWTWRIAPNGEEYPGLDVERLVLGVSEAHASLRRASTQGGPHVH